jgi:hypothetical protein
MSNYLLMIVASKRIGIGIGITLKQGKIRPLDYTTVTTILLISNRLPNSINPVAKFRKMKVLLRRS